jgi:hypothetical protein
MFFASYELAGDPDTLLAAHERMVAGFPTDSFLLHLSVRTETGITIYDSCPSREQFEVFSSSDEFAAALAAAGLPTPRVTPIGDVHYLYVGAEVRQ